MAEAVILLTPSNSKSVYMRGDWHFGRYISFTARKGLNSRGLGQALSAYCILSSLCMKPSVALFLALQWGVGGGWGSWLTGWQIPRDAMTDEGSAALDEMKLKAGMYLHNAACCSDCAVGEFVGGSRWRAGTA
jgi:hypothetical protein